jgi:hypothetical protein
MALVVVVCTAAESRAEADFREFDQPPHDYFKRTPTDRFTRMRADLEAGRVPFDRSSEKAFLTNILDHLGIPVSSQMLVFSTTSLQLSRISPTNPRALYFTDDLYLGFIPGGRIELVSLDPDLGGVFHIFDVPRESDVLRIERATRCMNCHAGEDTGHVPGLVISSVVPGPSGGSLEAFRRARTGHGIPLQERFGGWYLTGLGGFTNHWGNTIGRFVDEVLTRIPNPPGERVQFERYPLRTSDLLPQLIHEHQVGFVNRAVEATYRARTYVQSDGARLTAEHDRLLAEQAELLVRYLLFKDEVPLPAGGVEGDPAFREDYRRNRREVEGLSLKDLELRTRLFRHRCSPMIYTPVFTGLPGVVKERVYRRLGEVLRAESKDPEFAYLAVSERAAIRKILRGTLTDLPGGW